MCSFRLVILTLLFSILNTVSTDIQETDYFNRTKNKNPLVTIEISRDNGNITFGWAYINGTGAYVGDQYTVPTGGPWFLTGIKYYVWAGWPDYTYQGFGVACWKMISGYPGPIAWPVNGQPIYNPNTGANWKTQPVSPSFNLSTGTPNGFLVGICFLYNYPFNDAFGVDNTGVSVYDWSHVSGGSWTPAPYGKGSARAFLYKEDVPSVETITLGNIRTLYR